MRDAGARSAARSPHLRWRVRRPRRLLWERWGVVGEFDGMGKYRFGSGQAGDIVAREKLREDAIRDTGLEVIRWVWADLGRFDAVKARFERACARSRRR